MERNQNPHLRELAVMDGITPALRRDGSIPFDEWKKTGLEKLNALLGLPLEPCAPEFLIEKTEKMDGYTRVRFTFQSEEGYFVPCYFLIPDGEGKRPTAICLQGHSKGAHISLGEPKYPGDAESIAGGRDFAIRAMREGFCALVIEQRAFGECGGTEKGPQCHVPTMAALLTGRTMIGLRVWDVSRAIDMLEAHFAEYIDFERLICLGNSGGGTTTFYAGVLDERIRLAMPSCYVCTFRDSIAAMEHCVCNFIPGVSKWFDMGDIGGLMAPRPMVVVCGRDDPIFPLPGVKKTFALISGTYEAAGAAENCRLVIGNGEHRFYPDDAWPMAKEILGL